MKTNFTRLRYILAALMCCLVSMGVWGQANESFAKSPNNKTNYTNFSWVGDDGVQWSAAARTDQTINDKAICMQSNGAVTSAIYPNGIGNLNFKYARKFTGTKARALKIEINGITIETISGIEKEKENQIITYSKEINIEGNVQLKITSTGTQVAIDDISWTSYTTTPSQTSTPTFTPESGKEFTESLDVTLACATEGAAIHYTTDGTDPSVSSALYTTPFSISETTTVKAIAVKDGLDNSEIAEATYTKVLPTPNFAYSTESVTTNLGEIFAAPTLTYNGSNDLSGLNISYASSNSNVATVDIATGEVQILNEGTTTISATVEATDTHLTAQTSYELTVIDPNKIILLSTNIQDWTETSGSGYVNGTYTNERTGIVIDGSCIIRNSGTPSGITNMGICSEGYIQIRSTSPAGVIIIPPFSNVKSIELNIVAGVDSRSITLYNNNDLLSTFTATKTGDTYKYIVPEAEQSNEFNFIIKDQSGPIYITDINVIGVPAKPSSTTDINGTMTLTGPWAAADLSALDLTDPTITVINMVGITIPTDAPDLTPANPNCLIYVADGAAVPTTWKNVVAGGFASTISLQDGYNFYNAEEIITETVTYTRTFAKGWNTFSLPFDAEIPTDDVIEEFDLQTESSIKFKTATGIYANQAYLIDIATDNTEKTFTATEVLVPVTASTGDIFKSNFTKQTGADVEGKYILVLEDDKEVFAPANDQATLAAFRGYIDLSATPNPAKKFTIEHDGGATNVDHAKAENSLRIYSENGALVIYSNEVQNVQIYAIDGRMIKNIQLSEGNNTINGLSKGIYLMNHQKAVVN